MIMILFYPYKNTLSLVLLLGSYELKGLFVKNPIVVG